MYIVTPVSGAIIGYCTNWLAIKMLFRPHEEKRILGLKVPFTPGLLPKEKPALAKKIGETVGKYLLTDEVLKEAFTSDKIKTGFYDKFDEAHKFILDKDYSVDELFDIFFKENKEKYLEDLKIYIEAKEKEFIFNKETENFIKNAILKNLSNYLKEKPVDDVLPIIKEKLLSQIEVYQKDYLDSGELKEIISKKSDEFYNSSLKNLTLKEIIPEKFIQGLNLFLEENLPKLSVSIKNLFENNPEIDEKLRLLTYRVIEENITGLASMFISRRRIYESIKNGAIDYLESEENQKLIISKINEYILNLSDKEVEFFINKISPEGQLNFKNKFLDFSLDLLNSNLADWLKEFINKSLDEFLNKDLSLYDIILKFRPNIYEESEDFLSDKISLFMLEIEKEVNKKYPIFESKIKKFKINTLLNKIDQSKITKLKSKLQEIFVFVLEKGASYVIKNIDIPKIVEDKLNTFEMPEAEDIVLSVVDRELKAITNLGALLGLGLGIFTVLIQSL